MPTVAGRGPRRVLVVAIAVLAVGGLASFEGSGAHDSVVVAQASEPNHGDFGPSDRHVMGFAAASDPTIDDDAAVQAYEQVQDWSGNVVRVERVVSDRVTASAAVGAPGAVGEDDRPVVLYRLTGDFVLRGMPRPQGAEPITGRFAYVAVDPVDATGVDVAVGQGDYALEPLGSVTVVFPSP